MRYINILALDCFDSDKRCIIKIWLFFGLKTNTNYKVCFINIGKTNMSKQL